MSAKLPLCVVVGNKIKLSGPEGIWLTYVDNDLYISNNKNKCSKEIYKE